MAHRHRYTTVAGTRGAVVRCGCGKTRTEASGETFTTGRDRRVARAALKRKTRP